VSAPGKLIGHLPDGVDDTVHGWRECLGGDGYAHASTVAIDRVETVGSTRPVGEFRVAGVRPGQLWQGPADGLAVGAVSVADGVADAVHEGVSMADVMGVVRDGAGLVTLSLVVPVGMTLTGGAVLVGAGEEVPPSAVPGSAGGTPVRPRP
jgi:hypothetical protein